MEVTNWVLAPDSCPDNKMTSRLQLVQIILICLIILDLDFEETTCQDTLFSILLCFLFAPSPDYPGHSDHKEMTFRLGHCVMLGIVVQMISSLSLKKVFLVKVVLSFIQSWEILFFL